MGEKEPASSQGTVIEGEGAVETLARKQGWVPPEEYEGREGREPVSAEEYLEKGFEIRGSMKNRLDKQTKQISDMGGKLTQAVDAMGSMRAHYEKKTKHDVERAIADLKEEKKDAIDDKDHTRVEKIDKQIDNLKDEAATTGAPSSGTPSPIFAEWNKGNEWYTKDSPTTMTVYADQEARLYKEANPSAPGREVLDYAAKRVKQHYPEEFEKGGEKVDERIAVGKQTPDPVAAARRRTPTGGGKKWTHADLNREQQTVMENMINAAGNDKDGKPVINQARYIQELGDIGELS